MTKRNPKRGNVGSCKICSQQITCLCKSNNTRATKYANRHKSVVEDKKTDSRIQNV